MSNLLDELAADLFGSRRAETLSGASTTTFMKGLAVGDSSDGSVAVIVTGGMTGPDVTEDAGTDTSSLSDAAIEVATTVAVSDGDVVEIALTGANGAGQPTVMGVIGGGDTQRDAIESAVEAADAAKSGVDEAKKEAEEARAAAEELKKTAATQTYVDTQVDAAKGEVLQTVSQNYVDTETGATLATKSELSSTADTIRQEVSETYATSDDVAKTYATQSSVTQTASDIRQEVSETYLTSEDAEKTYATQTALTQSADSITMAFTSTTDQLSKAVGDVSDDLGAYKTDNDAAVSKAQDAADAAQTALDEYKTDNDAAVEKLDSDLRPTVETVQSRILFYDSDGQPSIELVADPTSETGLLKTVLTNEKLSFVDNGVEVAYVSGQRFQMADATAETLSFGDFVWELRSNGNLSLKMKG
jgi:type II secretory pathway pseudopilin PulG